MPEREKPGLPTKPTVDDVFEKMKQIDIDKVAAAYEERNKEIDTMLAELQDVLDDGKITDWEIDFVNSITDWRGNGRDITINQHLNITVYLLIYA